MQLSPSPLRTLTLIALVGTVSACTLPAVGPPSGRIDTASVGGTARQPQRGAGRTLQDHLAQAQSLLQRAEGVSAPLRQDLELKAVAELIRAGYLGDAQAILTSVDTSQIDASYQSRRDLLTAHIALLQNNPKRALASLRTLARTPRLGPGMQAEIHWLQAQAKLRLGRKLEAVTDLIARERYLSADLDLQRNQQQLWSVLETASTESLLAAREQTQDPIMLGWLDLAQISIENSSNAYRLRAELENWRRSYRQHPASSALLSALSPSLPGTRPIRKIALLLPLASHYGKAAQAVHDGFLAMHAADGDPEKPQIAIYDTGAEPGLIGVYYELAERENADLIVGPLGKEAVNALAASGKLSVPTLLLGNPESAKRLPADTYQLGLDPAQEAIKVAERAYLDGNRVAAILYPNNPWGERLLTAFTDQWLLLGGIVAESQAYRTGESDYSAPIKNLLNVDQSESRKRLLGYAIKEKLKFEARRRQDVDCIFIAAQIREGRLLKPQINFFQGHDLPTYATSHIYSGRPNPRKDADLNGIIFGDMPWLLVKDGKVKSLKDTVQGDWPNKNTQFDRLYAMGIDAYGLAGVLARMRADPGFPFRGVSAVLNMDAQGKLQRRLTWARFDKGLAHTIDRYIDYDHMESLDLDGAIDASGKPAPRQPGGTGRL